MYLQKCTPWSCLFSIFFVRNSCSRKTFKLFICSNKKIWIYGYKLVRAAKQSELKRCSKYRRNHGKLNTVNYLSRRKSEHLHDLLHIQMNGNTLVDSLIFCFNSLCLTLFFFYLHFWLLNHFKIIRSIVKSLSWIHHWYIFKLRFSMSILPSKPSKHSYPQTYFNCFIWKL